MNIATMRKVFLSCVMLAAATILAPQAGAVPYYLDWSANVSGSHPTFGEGFEFGDYIVFTPTDFSAESGDGYDISHRQLSLLLNGKDYAYSVITGIDITLRGTGHLIGGSGGFTRASGAVTLREDTPLVDLITEDFSTFNLTGSEDAWEAEIHLTPAFTRDPLLLTIGIDLLAYAAGLTDFAWISTDMIAIKVTTATIIPLPASLPLFGSAVLLLMGKAAKKRRAA